MQVMTQQMTMEVDEDGGEEGASLTNATTLFARNMSENSRLAFAAFQRVVCGRNMSSEQLFTDGGAATRYEREVKEMHFRVSFWLIN